MKQSTTTYTKRENARRAGVAAGIPSEHVVVTVRKNGDELRFGWIESATPVKPKKATTGNKTVPVSAVEQEERNGVKRPKAGGVCAAVWAWLDARPAALVKEAKGVAPANGWNQNNVVCEYYRWRKYNGISGMQQKQPNHIDNT